MTQPSHDFSGPMRPAPQLAAYAKQMDLPSVGNIFYYDSGSGTGSGNGNNDARRHLILIHGLQDEADSWRHVFGPLAQHQRVLALDLPGFGRSDKRVRRYDIPFYAQTVLAWMDRLALMHATLMGNSMGAMIAEHIALTQPARVSRLVLVDGTIRIVKRPQAKFNLWRQLFADYYDRQFFAALRKDPQAAYDTLAPYYGDLAGLPEEDRAFLFQRVNERVWDDAQRRAALAIQSGFARYFVGWVPKLVRQIPKSPVPTQVIWGERDHILDGVNGQQRAHAQPRTSLHFVPQAGHLPHQETPAAFLQALIR